MCAARLWKRPLGPQLATAASWGWHCWLRVALHAPLERPCSPEPNRRLDARALASANVVDREAVNDRCGTPGYIDALLANSLEHSPLTDGFAIGVAVLDLQPPTTPYSPFKTPHKPLQDVQQPLMTPYR